jgi:hypothetical protein
LPKKYEIFIPKFGRQSSEKKTACDKRDSEETNPVLLALAVPEVGMFMKKISWRSINAPQTSRFVVTQALDPLSWATRTPGTRLRS